VRVDTEDRFMSEICFLDQLPSSEYWIKSLMNHEPWEKCAWNFHTIWVASSSVLFFSLTPNVDLQDTKSNRITLECDPGFANALHVLPDGVKY